MNPLLLPVAHRYRMWMDRGEKELCFRANDRIVRPFEYGIEWASGWPCSVKLALDSLDLQTGLSRVNECCIENSAEFFGYKAPSDFRLTGEWLEFTSPVTTR